MNYLAHAYLSFEHPEILAGNMISDFVKGSSKFGYTATIQKGIVLHKAIDAFTDVHPATKKAKEIFRPHYRLYSGAIMDILYDHYLANDENIFTSSTLKIFSSSVYETLEEQNSFLPPRFSHMLTYMKLEDWLCHYRTKEGMQKSLKGLVRRAAYLNESETAYQLFLDNYTFLQDCYDRFFPDVKVFAKEQFNELLSN